MYLITKSVPPPYGGVLPLVHEMKELGRRGRFLTEGLYGTSEGLSISY